VWFNFMEYYFLLAIHTDNYINALAIYNLATGHQKFKKLSTSTREKWKIYDVYLNYIIESKGDSNQVLLTQKRKSQKPAQLVKETLLYPKDQRIFTVLMVIGQLLFVIEKKGFHAATEKIDRLKNYANRQLKKEEYYRTIQFIRLLQQLAKADYNISQLTNTEKYYNRLIETPFYYRGLIPELEVIPYEKLWNMILERIGSEVMA
jgi:actin-related protein